ncbi:elongator complex protein 2 [Triplophysa rosa]|uniref:Elongator complex protein 2 n=1 Tax=Triplophysa rosa TaxID=992332 RepID=A0A9W7TL78_TRIRA|nr:elongator complex protein 2 [Triplophysa rosa]KAI7798441.1 putative elongator complex protein 2 [Triplophysa rosa]
MEAPVMDTCHVSCCANPTPNVVSWGRGGLIAFGTCNSVVIYNPQEIKIVEVLNKHTGRVNAVQWVYKHDCSPETQLVSGGSDNNLIVWEKQDGNFNALAVCSGHSGPVCAVDAVSLSSHILLASVSSDSTVKLWTCIYDKAECLQTISFGSGFVMDVSLALLPGSRVPVLACGGDDSKVQLYVQNSEQFQMVLTLTGHEDWVRGVEWAVKDGELLLASCSQDCLIRVWRLFAKTAAEPEQQTDTVIKMKENVFEVSGDVFAMTLETVLAGHENWVYGIHWQPPHIKGDIVEQPLKLLSASMDKTMILWGPEEDSGVWVEQVRVGEVGGNTLGFNGCQMSPDGSMILAHAFHGALHLWHHDNSQGEWRPAVVVSGHFNAVQDLSWDPEGEFIITVGSDQTTRFLTPWKRKECSQVTWHEISRPQIHGYDVQCLTMVGRFQFVSGADEKVLRVFRAPRNFVENFASISCTSLEKLLGSSETVDLPEGASTPALGLSNKAVFQGDLTSKCPPKDADGFSSVSDQYKESYFKPLKLTEPPTEDDLLQNTLWPEVQKLYGHGFEMFCLASDSSRTVVASACKASKAEHAVILLWSSTSWKPLQSLSCHSLTVTQMAFSPIGRLLLAVSRDRTWSLWKRENPGPDSEPSFSLYANTSKDTAVHTRIIWSCDWSSDSKYFATSSRDKKVIVWGHRDSEDCVGDRDDAGVNPCSSVLDVGDSATAMSICPHLCSDQSYLLAVGLENGKILLYKWRPMEDLASGADWSKCGETDRSQSHTLVVNRLRWRPRRGRAEDWSQDHDWVQLASAGADHAVKIFNVRISSL